MLPRSSCCSGCIAAAHVARKRERGYDLSEEDSDMEGFIEEEVDVEDWRLELQKVTGYDPSK